MFFLDISMTVDRREKERVISYGIGKMDGSLSQLCCKLGV
jgi:hypothetical protein